MKFDKDDPFCNLFLGEAKESKRRPGLRESSKKMLQFGNDAHGFATKRDSMFHFEDVATPNSKGGRNDDSPRTLRDKMKEIENKMAHFTKLPEKV